MENIGYQKKNVKKTKKPPKKTTITTIQSLFLKKCYMEV